ncbi:MAG: butyrate kinase [Paludibacteraceae bacterium]
MHRILVINPGSTSTKVAVFEDNTPKDVFSIRHSVEELNQFLHVIDQFDFRYNLIMKLLIEQQIMLDFSVVMGRGGMMSPVKSGVYEINEKMLGTLRLAERGEHASNLGAFLADKIARQIPDCKAYIADPVSVDEFDEIARISGLPEFPRQSIFHALNQKAAGRHHAKTVGKRYDELNLVIAHLGGGVSVGVHRKGKVVDVNQGLDGYGPFSPERSGTIDAGQLVKTCFSGQYTEEKLLRMLAGKGGLIAHLGSNDVQELVKKAENGDKKITLTLQAMSYSIGKEIGAMLTVLCGDVDGVILTGGVAFSHFVVNYIKKMIEPYARVFVYAGEDEMGALAANAVRVSNGETISLEF